MPPVLCSDPIPAMYDYMPITVFDRQLYPAFVVAVDVAGIQLLASATTFRITPSMSICASTTTARTAVMPMRRWWTTRAAAAELLTTLIPEMGAKITPEIASLPVYGCGDRHRLLPVQQHDGGDPQGGSGSDRGRSRRGKAERAPVREPLPRAGHRRTDGFRKPGILLRRPLCAHLPDLGPDPGRRCGRGRTGRT